MCDDCSDELNQIRDDYIEEMERKFLSEKMVGMEHMVTFVTDDGHFCIAQRRHEAEMDETGVTKEVVDHLIVIPPQAMITFASAASQYAMHVAFKGAGHDHDEEDGD